jgi:serine-type D-Ala-D-Ala carboxypeptidase (penicillin-binding protein 5/6)
MFDSCEEKMFRRALNSIVRIFIVLIALFVSAEFVLNRVPNSLFTNTTKETAQSKIADNHTPSASAIIAVESGRQFLAQMKAEERDTSTTLPPPAIRAGSYIVASVDSGQVYAEKNADEVRPIASVSKLVTALTASVSFVTNPAVEVTPSASGTRGNSANLEVGEKIRLSDLYYPLLLSSANDAALAVADYYGEEIFSVLMNKQVKRIGMLDSHFVEPSGLSEHNQSTARDLLLLSRYIHKNTRFIFDITEIEEKTIESVLRTGGLKSTRYKNIHQLRDIEGFAGGKNGFTSAAGKTLLSLFTVKNAHEKEETVVIIVLDSDDSARDSLTLLSWLKPTL